MTIPKRQTEFHDSELARHCAFSIPGVALTLGRQNWKCLRGIYTVIRYLFGGIYIIIIIHMYY